MRKKIKVAMVILEYAPIIGGAQRQLALLAPHLKALDVEVFVLTRHSPGLAAFEMVDGVPVHRLQAPGPKVTASLLYTASSLRQLFRLKPDLVHAYSLFSPLTTAAAYKILTGTPLVVKILRGGRLGDVYRLQHKMFGEQRMRIFRQSVDAFISISQEISAELGALDVPEARRPYIPNGVDTDHFCPVDKEDKIKIRTALGLPAGPLVVYTGRLVPEKKVDLLLEAWSIVHREHPDATLVIVGEGAEAVPLQQKASTGVIFTGGVEDVRPYLQAGDIFVLPSLNEGLSNALLEAMSAGLGVVATAVGGAPDVIQHGENGWLIPPGDPQVIQDAIKSLIEQPELCQSLAFSARQVMVERYSLPVVAQQLRSLYDRVLI
jgi:glycosyltransferase involved in cell wall biosynthesis